MRKISNSLAPFYDQQQQKLFWAMSRSAQLRRTALTGIFDNIDILTILMELGGTHICLYAQHN